ncbi:MAG: DUF1289 domain-containing protein [Leptospira sp.]|nr:DUF1289 domain-containing protein [Leptospira sp.]
MSPKSPCTKVCMMDPDSGFCAGCFRTLKEIGMWTLYSDEEKEKIRGELVERKNQIQGNPP